MEEKVSSDSFNSTKNISSNNYGINPTKGSRLWDFTLAIVASFITLNLVSNIIAGMPLPTPVGFFGIKVVPMASILYGLVLVIDDVTTNCLGYQAAKKSTWLSIVSNLFLILTALIIKAIVGNINGYPEMHPEVMTVLNFLIGTIFVIIGSIVAFFCSSFVNSYILQGIKRHQVDKGISTENKFHIFIRTYGSSIPAQIVDSLVFILLAFWIPSMCGFDTLVTYVAADMGKPEYLVAFGMILNQAVCKLFIEALMQPIIIHIIPKFTKKTGIDEVDRDGFNPFKI